MEEGYELDERGQCGDGQVEEEAGQGDQPVQEVAPQVVESREECQFSLHVYNNELF